MNFFVVLGIVLLLVTFWEFRRGESDTIFLLDWWLWFDVSQSKTPLLYWLAIAAQAIAGIVLIVKGLSGMEPTAF